MCKFERKLLLTRKGTCQPYDNSGVPSGRRLIRCTPDDSIIRCGVVVASNFPFNSEGNVRVL